MTNSNVSALSGDTFEFKVPGQRFAVHRALVARVSEPLASLMENGMKGSVERSSPLGEVDSDTFGRFVEFIYTGDYTPASPTPREASQPVVDAIEKEEDAERSSTGEAYIGKPVVAEDDKLSVASVSHDDSVLLQTRKTAKKPEKKSKNKSHGWYVKPGYGESLRPATPVIESKKLPMPTEDVVTASPLPTCSMFILDSDADLDYGPILMSHATLYIFAHCWGILPLQRLSARRLDEALSCLDKSSIEHINFTPLIKTVYKYTSEEEDNPDILRMIVTNFAANQFDSIYNHEEFQQMLVDGGTFNKMFVGKLIARFGSARERDGDHVMSN